MVVLRRRRKKNANTTIFDVAKKAKVSISTVSLSLRGDLRITSKTRAVVLKAAERLHYQPNVAAQSLARQQTNLIAICGWFFRPSLEQSTYSVTQMLYGILDRLKGTRYAVYMINWSTHPDEHLRLPMDFSNQRFICGSIWLSPRLKPKDKKIARQSSLPLVLAEAILLNIDSVTVNNELGGYLGTKYLLESGPERNFVVISGDPFNPVQKERLKGVKRAMREKGRDWGSMVRYRAQKYGFLDGEGISSDLVSMFLTKKVRLAVFCLAGDWCAMGILNGLKKASIKVPDQIALLGYDGKLEGAYTNPSLSTVEQPLFDVGFAAAEELLERIENPKAPAKNMRLQPHLVVREST